MSKPTVPTESEYCNDEITCSEFNSKKFVCEYFNSFLFRHHGGDIKCHRNIASRTAECMRVFGEGRVQ